MSSEILLIRLDAPMMSFGAPMVDSRGVIWPFPGRSMITGLLGNALGYEHADHEKLERLQERLHYSVRCDREGTKLTDYQTVDLGQDFMLDSRAWTRRGRLETRSGQSSQETHIRERDYWVEAVYTLALALKPEQESPTITQLEQALRFPARPLFIGRKPCLPAAPLSMGVVQAEDVLSALERAPLHPSAPDTPRQIWWPVDAQVSGAGVRSQLISDQRDWRLQIHTGQRWIADARRDFSGVPS